MLHVMVKGTYRNNKNIDILAEMYLVLCNDGYRKYMDIMTIVVNLGY